MFEHELVPESVAGAGAYRRVPVKAILRACGGLGCGLRA